MKLLMLCLLSVVATTTGVILCDGLAKEIFHYAFFAALGMSFVLLIIGQFNS